MARKLNLDIKWLIFLVIIAAVVGTTIYMNRDHELTDANKIENTISADNGDLKINWERYPTTDIELTESLDITESGTYQNAIGYFDKKKAL